MKIPKWFSFLMVPFAVSNCGKYSDADLLASESKPVVDAGVQDASKEATIDVQAPEVDVPEVIEELPDDPDVIVEPLPNPFVPPEIEVKRWEGTLSEGGMFPPKLEVTYPVDPPQSELYPLVVFAHAANATRDTYRATMTHIAKFGYVVASVDNDLGVIDPDHHAPVVTMQRAMDILTHHPPSAVGSIVDAGRIVAAGHGVGAKAAVWLALEDTKIGAVLTFDPIDDDPGLIPQPSSKRPSLAPEQMAHLKVPSLYLASSLGPTGSKCVPIESNACRFHESTTAPSWFAVLEGFGHLQFMDAYDCFWPCRSCDRGSEKEHEARQVVFRGLSVAFLQHVFRGKTGYLAWLEGDQRVQLENEKMLLEPSEQADFCAP